MYAHENAIKALQENDKRAHAYRVLSPDRIDIAPRTFRTLKAARAALAAWVQNYKAQGYYSQTCYNGYIRHISLEELPDHCDIVTA